MANRYDPAAQLRAIADDLDRHRDTLDKMAAGNPRVLMAAEWLLEARRLLVEVAGPAPARVAQAGGRR